MNMTVGDIFDKWSILRMKVQLLNESLEEYNEYDKEILSLYKQAIFHDLADLIATNAKMWILESDIRNGKDMPLEEVGRRALLIRDHNRKRIEAKNRINEIFGDYQETKINHASERSPLNG